jgi:molecular chaperone GrpE (heat shock protein)
MNLKMLLNKTLAGAKLILAQPTMLFRNRDAVSIIAYHVVKEDEIGRPDLISLEHYGTHTKTDIVLKWNGISDPFSLQPGEILEIPNDLVPFYKLERPQQEEDNKIKNEFVQGKKLSQKDKNRIEALKKKYNKDVLLPPNVIALGKKNFKFTKGGTVILGAQAQNDKVTQSILSDLSSQSNQLVKDRINQLEGQIDDLEAALGAGSGSGSGSGGAGKSLTENQLENNLLNHAGQGGSSRGAGVGAGEADSTGGGSTDGSAPESTGGGNDIANDGAPCN